MRTKTTNVQVVNLDRNGQQFNPAQRTVTRAELPELFRIIEKEKRK